VIIGASRKDQLEENVSAVGLEVPEDVLERIEEVFGWNSSTS
jgi:aryl-alcohol dehydrogenase-like predicted oxidoreductase